MSQKEGNPLRSERFKIHIKNGSARSVKNKRHSEIFSSFLPPSSVSLDDPESVLVAIVSRSFDTLLLQCRLL